MDEREVHAWFAEYLDAFSACGRGDGEVASLLDFYGVPLLLTTDNGLIPLSSEDQVVAAAQGLIDDARASGYHHSDVLSAHATVLNAASVLYRGTFSRHRADGSEINRLTATYLVTEGDPGRRISALVLHSS